MNRYLLLYFCVLLFMPIIDTTLIRARRRVAAPGRVIERRSLFVLWLCIGSGMGIAAGLKKITAARIGLASPVIAVAAVALMLAGMIVRWATMLKLGGYFTPHVEVGGGQALVTDGVFRFVRHPAYAGILLVCAGIGLTFENWLSLAAAMAFAGTGVANRVRIEEAALRGHFGPAYEEYARHTKRFLPFIL
ncbi:MAG: isoprenylcysteine carboxylmethyltransferase family protein [Candidatus Aminicenantes bacterium]|nr:isoprenylcysteine carboxylmethyltransferase family protein [Candidatus Aminicenantes bacterium]